VEEERRWMPKSSSKISPSPSSKISNPRKKKEGERGEEERRREGEGLLNSQTLTLASNPNPPIQNPNHFHRWIIRIQRNPKRNPIKIS